MKNKKPPADAPNPNDPGHWRDVFLSALRTSGNVATACRAAEVNWRAVHNLRKQDAAFAEQWDEAAKVASGTLWSEARRRAVWGTEEPVYYGGEEIGTRRRYSDSLLSQLLQADQQKTDSQAGAGEKKADQVHLPKIVEYDVPDRPAAKRFQKIESDAEPDPPDNDAGGEE